MSDSGGFGAVILGLVAVIVSAVLFIGGAAWVFSFKGTDSGQVCVVREGGPFDGRAIKEVRQPGEGPKAIGAFNHQDCLPTTERDSNDVIEDNATFPTKDSVQVIADGQALFSLTTDPKKVEKFYKEFGRRKWDGEDIYSEKGWKNFLRVRFAPVLLDAQREVIGNYDCTALNNLCQYVQNAEAATKGDVKSVNNQQNLAAASAKLTETFKAKLRAAFRDDYFENVRYQNLRIRFEGGVQDKIDEAQSLRTQAANATLEAQKQVAQAKGDADRRVEVAAGERRAAAEQEKAYRLNPTKRQIDRIKAFCGDEGCDPSVIGNVGQTISSLAGKR